MHKWIAQKCSDFWDSFIVLLRIILIKDNIIRVYIDHIDKG